MMPSVQGYEERMNLRKDFSKILLEHTPRPPGSQQFMFGTVGGKKMEKRGCSSGIRSLLGYTWGFPYVEIFLLKV